MPRGGIGCKDISPKEVEDAFKLTAPGFVLTPEAASCQDVIYQGSQGGAQGTLDKYLTYIRCAPTTTPMHYVNITLNMLHAPVQNVLKHCKGKVCTIGSRFGRACLQSHTPIVSNQLWPTRTYCCQQTQVQPSQIASLSNRWKCIA